MRSKTNNLDIISIGDATLDNFVALDKAMIQKKGAALQQYLCVPHLDKMPIGKTTQAVAGNAANLAVGASRLKLNSACYTEMGDDETADKVAKQFKKEGVSLDYFKRNKYEQSNYTVVLNYKAERTQLIFREKREYKLPKFKKSKWLYLTAMENPKKVFYKDILDYIKKHEVKFGMNPGVLQIRKGLPSLKKLLKHTEVLILNREEMKELFGLKSLSKRSLVEESKRFLNKALEYGPKKVILTDGPNGAFGTDGEKFYFLPILKSIKVVERTGAGDAFSTGLISALVMNKELPEAMLWGAWNSNGVIGKIGPQEGLLTFSQMKFFIKKHSRYRTVEI